MSYTKEILNATTQKYSHEPEFTQAVTEVFESIEEFINKNAKYKTNKILERIIEPDRIVSFRVNWLNDKNEVEVNKGYRVQFNNALGIYKGGLRFHPTVNQSVLKFLGFEQTFKNALTGLPLGGAKGGSDFNPTGRSDTEILKFCQAFMTELFKYIGDDIDVPAGDIGVGSKEIGYLFGQYKKLTNRFNGVMTGKGVNWGGSFIRTEATGYGLVYFVQEMLSNNVGTGFKPVPAALENKSVLISGSGNVAQYAAEKVIELGGKVLTMSDSSGFIYAKNGITAEHLEFIKELKNVKDGRIKEAADKFKFEYFAKQKPWGIKANIALPCATQNEIDATDAKALVKNGVTLVAEGSNMSSTNEAIKIFHANKILFSPGKASNAGGVATSGLEMSQNSQHLQWKPEEVDTKLKAIMQNIHAQVLEYGKEKDYINYVKGANIAGFKRVADAMLDQGI